jgi:hypothetical protein
VRVERNVDAEGKWVWYEGGRVYKKAGAGLEMTRERGVWLWKKAFSEGKPVEGSVDIRRAGEEMNGCMEEVKNRRVLRIFV